METSAPPDVDGAAALRRLSRRVLPFRFALALLAHSLGRRQHLVGARDLLADTGLGDAQYGLGGSAFFVGYATMQLPSLCGARRLGAPRREAFILFCWGVTSMSFAALRGAGDAAEFTFYALRLLLGCFEAGCFPTIWPTSASPTPRTSQWYPRDDRHRRLRRARRLVAAASSRSTARRRARLAAALFARGRPRRRRGACDAAAWRDPAHAPWLRPMSATGWRAAAGAHRGQDVAARDRRRAGRGASTLAAVRNWRTWWAAATWALQCVAYWHLALLPLSSARSCPTRRRRRRARLHPVHRRHRRVLPTRATRAARATPAALRRAASCARSRSRAPLAGAVSAPLALVLLTLATSGAWATYGPFFSWPATWAAPDEAAAAVATITWSARRAASSARCSSACSTPRAASRRRSTHAMPRSPPPPPAPRASPLRAKRPPCAGRSERGARPPVTEAL